MSESVTLLMYLSLSKNVDACTCICSWVCTLIHVEVRTKHTWTKLQSQLRKTCFVDFNLEQKKHSNLIKNVEYMILSKINA